MRIRQIKPAYWLDKALHVELTAAQREFYIGLWMLADDGGWLEWDVTRIGAELYPYRQVARRERDVVKASAALAALAPDDPHLLIHDCGHAQVPKLVDHQRFGGRPVLSVRDTHQRTCARMRADARPGRVLVGNGKVGNGRVISAPEARDSQDDETTAFGERLAAAGGVHPIISGKAS